MKRLLLLAILASAWLAAAGCRSYTYDTPDGHHLSIQVFGTDTKFGKLTATAPGGVSLTLENYDAEAKAIDLATEIIKHLPVVPIAP